MADTKITALTALTAADPANDVIPIVDVSDTSMAASGTTKKISVNNILGASGTATLASAAITGAATVGTTLGVTGVSTLASAVVTGDLTARTTGLIVNATGVGMGMTPTDNLSVGSATYASVNTKIDTIVQSSLIFKGTPDALGYEYAKIVSGRESSPSTYGSFLAFYTEGKNSGTTDTSVERARFNSTGNLAFVTGKGIDFSAVTGGTGTATANVLNDYEEGTWVPTLKFGGANVGMSASFTGRYTKVGRAVTVNGIISISNKGSSTGDATITGLPFTSANTAAEYTAVSLRLGVVSFLNAFQGYVGSNSSQIEMEQITSAGVISGLNNTNFSNNSVVIVNFTYTV